jgi:hypothetical protein
MRKGSEKRRFWALGFPRGHRQGSALKNLAGELHTDGVGCMLPSCREGKKEILVKCHYGAEALVLREEPLQGRNGEFGSLSPGYGWEPLKIKKQ